MTTYTKRDIRAADILAIILVGFGVILFGFAIFAATSVQSGKQGTGGGASPGLWIAAGVFVFLGVALNLKIKQLVRNKGREPDDYPGVPE